MSYIYPNSDIKLLHNVPLDNTYDHTIYFNNATDQYNYFVGLVKRSFSGNTYQRVNKGEIRLSVLADDVYDCNYLMFKNTSFGNKWFYAFIKSIEYVSNAVSKIEYELDVMQTWFFDYNLGECFVEREHSATDNIGDNLLPEKVETGFTKAVSRSTYDMPLSICILASRQIVGDQQQPPTGKVINGIYTAAHVIAGIPVTSGDASSIQNMIDKYVSNGFEDDIITIYQYPSFLGDASTTTPQSTEFSFNMPKANIDGYAPRNKKLFTYPYNFLIVSNNSGETAEYKYEEFYDAISTGQTKFDITGVFVSSPCVVCTPKRYRNSGTNYDYGLTYSNFPMVPWVGDAYKAWWAQNKSQVTTSLVASALGSAAIVGMAMSGPAAITAGYVGGVAGGTNMASMSAGGLAGGNLGSKISQTLAKKEDMKNTPPQVHGQVNCDSFNVGVGRCGFSFYAMQITAAFARIIDSYFDMFGYATHEVKTPNRNVRPHWTYTKTIGCTLIGSVPADDANKICSIYDHGVTFWKNGNEVGNYSLNNSV